MKIRKLLLSAIVLSLSTLALGKVNINTANVDELAALKGIGEAKWFLLLVASCYSQLSPT